jgi:hypothetical protein
VLLLICCCWVFVLQVVVYDQKRLEKRSSLRD